MFQASDFKLTHAGPSLVPQLAGTGLYQLLAVIAGIAVLAVSAHIKIPFYPVPVTMQTLAVLAIGMTYGTRLGGATVLGYLGAGAAGAPVFAGGAGIAYMMGPTGGYLLGFFVAAIVLGALALFKLFMHPLMMALVLLGWPAIGPYPFDPLWIQIALIFSCLPVAANVFNLAEFYGVYSGRTATSIMLSTLIASVSVPVMMFLIIYVVR